MFWWLGTYQPLGGPFCVHAAEVASPVAATEIHVPGGATDPGEDPDAPPTIVGEIFCPGVASIEDELEDEDDVAGEIAGGGPIAADAFTPGTDDDGAQLACEDD